MPRVFLSLGSNLGDRLATLRAAVRALTQAGAVEVAEVSPLYEAEPWESEPGAGTRRQWYLNCVVAVETSLTPRALLDRVHAVEAALGRTRPAATPEAGRFLARPVDIDILLYDDAVISGPDDLHVPHLLLDQRGFVLRPLADVAPRLVHPTLYRTIHELLAELDDDHEVRRGDYPLRWLEG